MKAKEKALEVFMKGGNPEQAIDIAIEETKEEMIEKIEKRFNIKDKACFLRYNNLDLYNVLIEFIEKLKKQMEGEK